jgi:hypothetical protein
MLLMAAGSVIIGNSVLISVRRAFSEILADKLPNMKQNTVTMAALS